MRGALLAATSATLLLVTAPPIGLTPLALLALVPLLLAMRRARRAADAFVLGWITGALFHAGLLLWLLPTIARMQRLALPAATGWWTLFVSFHALQFACAMAVARLGQSATTRVVATVAGWVLLEWSFPKVFPWSLGAALGPHPLLRQAADLAGVYGLAAVVVAVNALVAEAVAWWSQRPAEAGAALALASVVMVAPTLYALAGAAAAAPLRFEVVRLAVVQAGPSADASDPRTAAAIAWANYASLSDGLTGRADVIAWPESVLPIYLRNSAVWQTRAETLAAHLHAALVIGALDRAAGGDLSATYVFTPTLSAIAAKATLVPFGEYLPAAAQLSPLRAWRPAAARRSGPAPPVVDAGVRIASSICFEAILPGHFNDAVRDGAAVLLNLSDDSWFASPWAAAQHLEMTRLRAVETRRSLVRASHSGTSAVVDPRGNVVAALPYGARGTLVRSVELEHELTPYVRWGDTPLLTIAAVALLVVVGKHHGSHG